MASTEIPRVPTTGATNGSGAEWPQQTQTQTQQPPVYSAAMSSLNTEDGSANSAARRPYHNLTGASSPQMAEFRDRQVSRGIRRPNEDVLSGSDVTRIPVRRTNEEYSSSGDYNRGVAASSGSVANELRSRLEKHANETLTKGQETLDRFFPPEQRAMRQRQLHEFSLRNPKLSAFLGTNLALTGIPLALFFLFALGVTVFCLATGVCLGLLAALPFIGMAVGAALLILLPTIAITTLTACFFCFWGLVGVYLLRWFNGEDSSNSSNRRVVSYKH
ncbi:hypothetical protein K470DRAFT_256480 [Piedraia hortae CBS 480.64]|uniref:Uncharacterized protein n=1 Tax=Piedraia hortae CBS 480.64 TaxID=1314780 RepID=A0A6A7C3A5_9PEZI|nr:hypothetical protein K470DRAFT_256480 [Piedraia hortae CBS 480.64]